MPTTSKQIEEEILKQQNLLEYLHEHIQQMRQHSNQQVLLKQKEDEMWAVQTGITVLKRKLKNLTEVVEEKQLIASKLALSNEIGDEKKAIVRNGEKDDNTDWEQLCAEEERKNAELLAELIRYRYVEKLYKNIPENILIS
uniref:Uncharacterized protein n=1 Tax=Meloidogyne javanica TaxID=6303 RepID=A0A915NAH4_MELJA